ncbi:hypothetical protein [Streptomyces erythrochromogenes]|uniref:hypothetical protein n=1 Tax=Streptomyces erythrochromogenes TaxID=285574 RepID=UPI0036CC1411
MTAVRPDVAGSTVDLEGGGQLWARAAAASGSFGPPHRPDLPGQPGLETFAGQVLHRPGHRPARTAPEDSARPAGPGRRPLPRRPHRRRPDRRPMFKRLTDDRVTWPTAPWSGWTR